MNIRIVFYTLPRSSMQKTVMCPFFFKTLKIEIFFNQNPDRLHFAYIQPPVAMLLVFTCLLNSSHHPACNASTDCSAEVQLFQEQKDKAVEVGTITMKTLCCDEFFFADVQLHDI